MQTLSQKIIFSALIAACYAVILFLTQGENLFFQGHLIRISILLIMGVVYSVMSHTLQFEHQDKIELLNEVKERIRAQEKLKASESLLRSLHEITIEGSTWESRLERLLVVGCSNLDLSTGIVMQIVGDSYEIRHIVTTDVTACSGRRYPVKDSYCGWIIQSREPVTFSRPDESDWHPPSEDPLLAPQAFAGVPIIVNRVIYGALCFSSSVAGHKPFAGYEKTFLKLCAQWIGHELEREAAEADIRHAKEQAEAASRAKSDFLATMSHEIRTPMNTVIGMSDLLWETPLSLKQKEYLGIICRSSKHLMELIDDILDISKIEAGHFALETLPFDLNDVLEKCAEALAIRAQEKELELVIRADPDIATDLIGDARALRQVIGNLLSNAIKFTERGEITVRVSNDKDAHRPGALVFTVSDTGIGIPPDKQALIFERFTQADCSTTRLYGGTGLGLAISKRLVELAGGRIWLESYVGRGSTFFFTVSFEVAPGRSPESHFSAVNLRNRRVHLAIAHPTTREATRAYCVSQQAIVTDAESVETAVAQLREAMLGDARYDLFIIDLTTLASDSVRPMQILAACQDINTMVIVIVPDVRSSVIAACYQLGLGGYVTKPVTNRKLADAIGRAWEKRSITAQAESSSPSTAERVHAINVLMAEDSADNQRLIQAYLKQTRYHLDLAENGQVAFMMYQRGDYDLILMDMQMPIMDGITATKKIREWENKMGARGVPIIALTAQALKEEVQRSLDAGCSGHLTKPIKKKALLTEIAKWIDQSNCPVQLAS
jgi:signal transduction histidine kinase/CheY-like chemotaxis protein